MFQFGELLTLGLCAVTVVYLLLHRRQVGSVRGLRPFLVPFVLMVVAFLATVLEGLPGGAAAPVTFWERSPQVAQRGGWPGALLNLLEHAAYLAAAVALAVVIWRQRRRPEATNP